MHELAERYGLTAPQVVEQSQKLDGLLNTYYLMKARKRMTHVFIGKFPLGQVVATTGVMRATSENLGRAKSRAR